MILVLLSPIIAEAVIPGIVMLKSVAFRSPIRFRLLLPFDDVPVDWVTVPVPPFGPVAVVVVVLILLLSEMLVLVGGVIPSVRLLSRLTCITTTSITTSDWAGARLAPNFCASAIWSGVPLTMMAFCDCSC